MLESIRTFVGIDFPEPLKRHLAGVQQRLVGPGGGNGLLWTPWRNFHLTLFYLGATPVSLLAPIEAALAAAAHPCPPFLLAFGRLGSFPVKSLPRVVFLEVEDPSGGLQRLYARVCTALAQFDFHPDHPVYRPHITLCKANRRASPRVLKPLRESVDTLRVDTPSGQMVEESIYFHSVPDAAAPVYRPLKRLPLSG
jgi:RNA 2',3'-cyclic 3'-phosphodiesterase